MAIETGYNTEQPIRERGWRYWHQLFAPRNLLIGQVLRQKSNDVLTFNLLDIINFNSRLCRWTTSPKSTRNKGGRTGGASDNATDVFSNQALNTLYAFAYRALPSLDGCLIQNYRDRGIVKNSINIKNIDTRENSSTVNFFITDPPYADAVNYEEITEFFIAWLRKNPPPPFDQWIWDSRRSLAIKGDGEDFRRGMVEAYSAMTQNMPDNGLQCVMFTHQNTSVWSDMVSIFWAAGLQVVSAWYIATETSSALKQGGYVQGTVTLLLRKRLQTASTLTDGHIFQYTNRYIHVKASNS